MQVEIWSDVQVIWRSFESVGRVTPAAERYNVGFVNNAGTAGVTRPT